ncbi:MAG: Flp family type IVb pilin [bacterium]
MKKPSQKPARDKVTAQPITPARLQSVRGGATAIEYGLLVAPRDPTAVE